MDKQNIKDQNEEELLPEAEETVEAEEAPTELTAVEKLQQELAEVTEKNLRLMAEYDNYRKRTSREKDAIYPEAVANTIRQILPVIDNFSRAVMATTNDESYKKGVEMTYQSLLSVLEKLGVEEFGNVGEDFDPNIHNAVMICEDGELPKDSIAEVFQKGYRMGDRILRVAMVKVVS